MSKRKSNLSDDKKTMEDLVKTYRTVLEQKDRKAISQHNSVFLNKHYAEI